MTESQQVMLALSGWRKKMSNLLLYPAKCLCWTAILPCDKMQKFLGKEVSWFQLG